MSSEINALPSHRQNPSCSWGKCHFAVVPLMKNPTPLTGRAMWAGNFDIAEGEIQSKYLNVLGQLLAFLFGRPLFHPWEECVRACRALWEKRDRRSRAETERLGRAHPLTAVCYSGQPWEDLEWDLVETLFPEFLQSLKWSRTSFQHNVSPGVNIKLWISFCPSSGWMLPGAAEEPRITAALGQLDTFCKVHWMPLCRGATEMSAAMSATILPDVLNTTKMRK